MDTYGTTSHGKIVIQKVDTLPGFSEYDVGRMILVQDEGTYYLGGLRGWLGIAGAGSIKSYQIDIGKKLNQLNASTLPVRNVVNYFDENDSIETALEGLATGDYLRRDSVKTKHIQDKAIDNRKIKFGINTLDVGAQNIPYQDVISRAESTVKDVLDNILLKYAPILNKEVTIDNWDFDTTTGMFYYSFIYENIRKCYPVIQLYDQYGTLFIPNKIVYNKDTKRLSLYVAYKMKATLSILG